MFDPWSLVDHRRGDSSPHSSRPRKRSRNHRPLLVHVSIKTRIVNELHTHNYTQLTLYHKPPLHLFIAGSSSHVNKLGAIMTTEKVTIGCLLYTKEILGNEHWYQYLILFIYLIFDINVPPLIILSELIKCSVCYCMANRSYHVQLRRSEVDVILKT